MGKPVPGETRPSPPCWNTCRAVPLRPWPQEATPRRDPPDARRWSVPIPVGARARAGRSPRPGATPLQGTPAGQYDPRPSGRSRSRLGPRTRVLSQNRDSPDECPVGARTPRPAVPAWTRGPSVLGAVSSAAHWSPAVRGTALLCEWDASHFQLVD